MAVLKPVDTEDAKIYTVGIMNVSGKFHGKPLIALYSDLKWLIDQLRARQTNTGVISTLLLVRIKIEINRIWIRINQEMTKKLPGVMLSVMPQ